MEARDERILYERILKILIVSNYAERHGMTEEFNGVEDMEKKAIDYYNGVPWRIGDGNSALRLELESNHFHARMQRDAALIMNAIKEEIK